MSGARTSSSALAAYADVVSGGVRAAAHDALRRWLSPPSAAEEALLRPLAGPVLDVGCGPGRHARWLRTHGVEALGVEISPAVAALARRRGARILRGSIFGPVPDPGRWRTALLLDGNLGIGGRPERLLRRVGELLHADGEIVVEVDDLGHGRGAVELRFGHVAAPFAWAHVGMADLRAHAAAAALAIADSWPAEDRWFARLVRCADPETGHA